MAIVKDKFLYPKNSIFEARRSRRTFYASQISTKICRKLVFCLKFVFENENYAISLSLEMRN